MKLFLHLRYTKDTFINIRWGPSPFLHSCRLHRVPSRDSNSGLLYSKPARYQTEPRCTITFNPISTIFTLQLSWKNVTSPKKFCIFFQRFENPVLRGPGVGQGHGHSHGHHRRNWLYWRCCGTLPCRNVPTVHLHFFMYAIFNTSNVLSFDKP